MRNLTQSELQTLLSNFADYRDNHCGGMARMTVAEFHKRYGLERYAA